MAKNTLGIQIPNIDNQELEIDIVGATSLKVKRFDEKTQDDIAKRQEGVAKAKKEPRNPHQEYERARILDSKKRDCVKAIWFKKAIAAMGGYFGIPRGSLEQAVYVDGDLIPIKYSGKKPTMASDRVRVGQGVMAKTSLAYRPEFFNWSCRLRIGFDTTVLTPHQVVSLLAHAGMKNGIGEWRPQKGGDHGRFQVFPAGASKRLLKEGAKIDQPKLARGQRQLAAPPVKRGPGRPRKDEALVANKVVRRGRPQKAA